jgi:hypothetical protein
MPAIASAVVTTAPPRPIVTAAPVAAAPVAAAPVTAAKIAAAPVAAAPVAAAPVAAATVKPVPVVAPAQVVTAAPKGSPVVSAPRAASFTVPPPRALTEGIPDPVAINKQKDGYSKSLDYQLKQGTEALLAQGQVKKELIEQSYRSQLAEYKLQVEAQLQLSSLQVDQQVQAQVSALQEAAILQKTLLEEKAAYALMDYQKRKALEDHGVKAYEVQRKYHLAEMKLLSEYQKVRKAGEKVAAGSATLPVLPVRTVI